MALTLPAVEFGRSTTGTAASTLDARKIYGRGATEVAALDGVTVGFAPATFTAIIAVVMVLGALAGLLAAVLPSRRAARIDVLWAVAAD